MSDESDAGPRHKRKRKIRYLEDSPASTSSSSGSPIIGSSSRIRRQLKQRNPIDDSTDSDSDTGSLIQIYKRKTVSGSGSPNIGSSSSRIGRQQLEEKNPIDDSTDSDSDTGSMIQIYKKKVPRVTSDTDSDSSTIIKRPKKTGRINSESDSNVTDRGFEGSSSSQWETDHSESEAGLLPKIKQESTSKEVQDIDSDSSDGQSEKCPICLLGFKSQEIGVPESCDHMFCLECIQEWSKNMNTCPVDRQEYNLILVRKNMNGKVVRQVQIEKPTPQHEVNIVEDPTFCEICGTSDNEDRMLLCDGCDLGFHLYCLTPPLEEVPGGAWYCNDCSPDDVFNSEIELFEIELLLNDAEAVGRPHGPRRNQSARLIPRTRQSERVRRQIANNRQQNHLSNDQLEHPSTSGLEDFLPVNRVSSSTSRTRHLRTTKKAKSKSKRKIRYKTVYEIDEATGDTVAVRKRQKKHKRYRKSRRRSARADRPIARPRTVKKRLAVQLGICAPRSVPQNLPDVKIQNSSNTLGGMRYQAGIPTLHLFGQNNQLDYFSDGDDEASYLGGPQMLVRRAANQSDLSALRSMARRKSILAPAVSSSTDLLDSILSSQEQLHARNSSYSVDKSGKFKIERRSQNNYIDINKQNISTRQRPNSYQNQNTENNPNFNRANTNNYHSHSLNQYHSTPTSTMESTSSSSFGGGSREQNEGPQDYTQRTLCASNEANTQGKRDKDEDNTGTNTPNSESEIDIYSDIETVSTSKADDGDLTAPSPPIISNTPNTGTDDDNNDSEPDMVIDDEKVQEPEKFQEDYKEETAVTSTVGFSSEFVSTTVHSDAELPHSSMEIQSGAIQSSNLMDNKNDDDEDSTDGCPNTSIYSKESINVLKDTEDIDSDDGCPNFSIYSKESKSVALHTDISLSAEDNTQTQDYQVGEISSSPNVPVPEGFMPLSPSAHVDEFVNYASDRNTGDDQLDGYQLETSANLDNPFRDSKEDTSKEEESGPSENNVNFTSQSEAANRLVIGGILGGLYSDSEDETVVKKDGNNFAISDINHMTEDISEEERSYTPCLDERATRQGLEGLDTELISDEDRNDFDESHELKTVSDGDALEINAKESELDFTRPEDYEEGEIVDKNKGAQTQEEPEKEKKKTKPQKDPEDGKEEKKSKKKEKDKTVSDHDKSGNKENESHNKESFKKLSKNTKERNYRDKDNKDKETTQKRTPSKQSEDREQNKKERKREKRKELERYNVRAIIADKPRPQIVKDQFGRDIRRTPTRSRSRSYTPPIQTSPPRPRPSPTKTRRSVSRHRSASKPKKSPSKEKVVRKRRPRSRNRSITRSRSRSAGKMRSKTKKRKRSTSRYDKRRKSRDRSKTKKKPRSRSRPRSRSVSARRKRGWNRREWTPMSMSRSPEPNHVSPSWTPPRLIDNTQNLRNENLMVMLNNSNKKKKDKRRKNDKRPKENTTTTDATRQKKRRRERERTPPPSKEVFASGDNILVSVSFNNENEVRDVTTRDRRKKDMEDVRKKKRKNRNRRDLSGVKPVAIIDLERSPFKEITPSPKDVIVLSDSDNNDNENVSRNVQQNICDSSQQVASPERSINYSTGPKTPPEPQIKFSLNAKPPQVRAINNPLHEPDDIETNDDVQEEISSRINEVLHKGPNTPPEPPNSPPSSPDAYDPFEPTKSRSPTPDPMHSQTVQSNTSINLDDNGEKMENRSAIDLLEKTANQTPDVSKSLTPPIADVQPADSQSSIHATPESNIGKSPERIGVVINQTIQPSLSTSKPVAQTTPFSSVPTSMITSTPISTNLAPSRINILNSTIITPPVASSIPQRIVLPNQVKSSPVKISPTKAAIKSTPIKPMPNKNNKSSTRKTRSQNTIGADDINLDFDSPYSPGSSDYEDLFEPPTENIIKSNKSTGKNNAKPSQKHQTTFDALFGSPNFHKNKNKNDKFKFGKKSITPTKTKTVGVKLDEDNLKILDELPNSAVEMQVKDKFLKKLNRQERVVEEVKLVLKPHYNKKRISKEEYKDILRRSVPKICHNKSGEINPTKIKNLIEAYVKKIRHSKKVTSSSSVNPQKVAYQEKTQPRLKTRWQV